MTPPVVETASGTWPGYPKNHPSLTIKKGGTAMTKWSKMEWSWGCHPAVC